MGANPFSLEATLKRPPRAATDTIMPGSNIRRSAVGVASATDDLLSITLPELGCWVTIVSDTDCYFHLGSGTVAAIAASVAGSLWLPANTEKEYWCRLNYDDRLVVIRKAADGFIWRWLSND